MRDGGYLHRRACDSCDRCPCGRFRAAEDLHRQLINLEIPAWGLLLVMLAYDEALALLTFVAVTAISTFVIVRLMEWRDASCR